MANENGGGGGPITSAFSNHLVLCACGTYRLFSFIRTKHHIKRLSASYHVRSIPNTTRRRRPEHSPEQDDPNGHDARITKPIHSFPKKPRSFIGLVLLVRPVPHHPQPFTVVEIAQYLFLFLSLKQASLCHLLGRRKAEIEENGLYVPVPRYLDTR